MLFFLLTVARCLLERKKLKRSKTHEVEMDENKVVKHTRRDSTAIGVTPSHPSAIVDLFQEVESIGESGRKIINLYYTTMLVYVCTMIHVGWVYLYMQIICTCSRR